MFMGDMYSTLPVKGNYLISNRTMGEVRTLVYPVPMKGTYFLGVHSTITPDGHVKIGPSATPAFSLENYSGLKGISMRGLGDVLTNYTKIAFSKQFGLVSALTT